jgi:anti-anti-sigma factor
MSVTITSSGRVTSIHLAGDLDYSNQEQVETAFEQALNGKPNQIQIDLKEATFIDSSVIRTFLKLHDQAKRNRSSMTIVNCSDHIREIFTIGGFDQIFEIN